MMALDATARTVCTIRRETTNTPVGAFVTLNDPAYVECAQALARKIAAEGGSSARDQAAYAFRRIVARPPNPAELARIVDFYEQQLDYYQEHAPAAGEVAPSPPADCPPETLAAWTVVANALLNLDEVLTNN
jgi:hypothetical protein